MFMGRTTTTTTTSLIYLKYVYNRTLNAFAKCIHVDIAGCAIFEANKRIFLAASQLEIVSQTK